jgi:hypothetical protein
VPFHELHLEEACCLPCELHGLLSGRIVGAVECHHATKLRDHRLEKLEALHGEIRELAVDTCESPARLGEAFDEADAHGIRPGVEHDGDALRRPLGRESH